MSVLTRTDLTKRLPLGDRVVQTFRATTGSADAAAEWIATGFSEILGVVGFAVKGTTAVADTLPGSTAPVAATGTITFSDVNVAGKLVTINGVIYTSDADPDTDGSQPRFYNVHATTEEGAAQHLADVINGGDGYLAEAAVVPAVTDFGFGTSPNSDVYASVSGAVVTITARVPGTGGNAITLTTDETNAVVSGATLSGGLDAVASANPAVGFNFVLNAQGTGVAAGTNNGDLGIECSEASRIVEVTVVGRP